MFRFGWTIPLKCFAVCHISVFQQWMSSDTSTDVWDNPEYPLTLESPLIHFWLIQISCCPLSSSEEVWVWKCGATRGRLCPNHPDASFSLDRGNYTAVRLLGPSLYGCCFCSNWDCHCINMLWLSHANLFSDRGPATCGHFLLCLFKRSPTISRCHIQWVNFTQLLLFQCIWILLDSHELCKRISSQNESEFPFLKWSVMHFYCAWLRLCFSVMGTLTI